MKQTVYTCGVCGNNVTGEQWGRTDIPICHHQPMQYREVEINEEGLVRLAEWANLFKNIDPTQLLSMEKQQSSFVLNVFAVTNRAKQGEGYNDGELIARLLRSTEENPDWLQTLKQKFS